MKNENSSSGLGNKLLNHSEIVARIKYLNSVKGIMYKNIAKDAGIFYYYFLQLINDNFVKQVFQEKSQIKICEYFKKKEIKEMLKEFSK